MSQQAMTEFFSALPDNPALAERVRNAVEHNPGPEAIEAVAHIATDAGFEVELRDVADFRARALEMLEDGELSEENLEKVAGGLFGIDDALFIVGGAAVVGLVATTAAGAAFGGSVGTVAVASAVSDDFKNKVTDFFSKW